MIFHTDETSKSEMDAPPVKRGRGRPKKHAVETTRSKVKARPVKRGRGRPKKCKVTIPRNTTIDDFVSNKTDDKEDLPGSNVKDLSIEPKELIEDEDLMDFLKESHAKKSMVNRR